uniref:Cell adhesion molecule n=1 Tax=Rhipicephalus appendiculatus TaxID=34631 RepID=A0A131YIA2_RHIAP
MASSRSIGFRLSAVLLAVLVLGNECAGVSAKRQTRKEKSQADEPTEATDRRKPPKPTDLKVEVSCDNVYNATWDYDFESDYKGFNATLCSKDECNTTHIDYKDREFSRKLPSPDSRYNFTLYAYNDKGRRSDPAEADFTSFPTLPGVQGLTVISTSPTELHVLWLSEWKQDIQLSACSNTAPCVNATVPARNQTHTFKGLEPSTTYEVTAQTVVTQNNRTCEGKATKESGTTLQLEPPTNLMVDVSCGNQAQVNWTYNNTDSIDGFLVMLCHGEEAKCENKTLPKDKMECSFKLPDFNATYNVSVRSFHENLQPKNKTYSKPVKESLTSFPELPELDDIAVTGVSETALMATWTTKWDGEIAFYICSMPEECQNHTILGTPRNYTFDGLASNTTYRIRAQSQVTLHEKECRGHLQERSASTFTKPPGEVRNVHHSVENGTILLASWELPKGSNVSGFTVKCEDPQTKYTESRDVYEKMPPYHVTVVLQEAVASFNCSLFAFNINATGGRLEGPAYNFSVATDGIAPPENLTLVERNATSFTLRWSVDPNATKCQITVTPERGFGEELEKLENACEHDKPENGTVTHTVTGLQPWTRYNVSVKNCRDTFCGLPASLINITEVAAPSEVRNFSHTIEKHVHARLTWEMPEHPNGPISGYVIQVYNEDRNETNATKVPGDLTETEINLRDQFNLFNVSISAFNEEETSNHTIYGPESQIQFETLGKGPLPPRPKPEEVKEDSLHLTWEEPHDPRYNITGFSIKVNDQPPKEINQSSYTIDHLTPWTEYNVSVASCTNKTSCGQWRHLELKTDFAAPSVPLDLKVPEAGTHWMLVQWEKPKVFNGPLSGYNVTFSHGSSHLFAVTTNVTYNFTNLVPGTTYDVAVYAFNEGKSVTKRGPPASLQATTQAETPNGPSVAVIVVAVIIPLLFVILIAAYFIYKRFQKRTGERTPLRSAEGL